MKPPGGPKWPKNVQTLFHNGLGSNHFDTGILQQRRVSGVFDISSRGQQYCRTGMKPSAAFIFVVLLARRVLASDEACEEQEEDSLLQVRDQGSKGDPPGCGHIVGWQNNEGTNIQGSGPDGDFPGISNQDSCQQECANYGDGCKGWTFVSGKCYLKSVVCPMKSEDFEIYSGYCNPGAPTYFGPS